MHEVDLDQIDFDTRHGQKVRRALLLQLKDRGGLKYREIAKLPEFASVPNGLLIPLPISEKESTERGDRGRTGNPCIKGQAAPTSRPGMETPVHGPSNGRPQWPSGLPRK